MNCMKSAINLLNSRPAPGCPFIKKVIKRTNKYVTVLDHINKHIA